MLLIYRSPKRVEKYDAMTKFTPNAYRKEESADGAPGPDHLGKKFTKVGILFFIVICVMLISQQIVNE